MTRAAANNAGRLAADCAALVRAASPGDWPHGFVVIPERLPGTIRGCAIGAGDGLAELYGYRRGRPAVLLDVAMCVADLDAPTPRELATLETLSLHEAAHSLTSSDTTADAVGGLLANAGVAVPGYSPDTVARQHGPAWAMAFWLLMGRAVRYRPSRRTAIRSNVVADVARYGYQADELERLAAGVPEDMPLRAQLVNGGAWAALLAMRLPNEEQRANAVVASGISPKERRE